MELIDYARVLKRRWRVIAVGVLACVGVAVALVVQAAPQYSSSATLFLRTPAGDSTQAYQGGLFTEQRVRSYADLAASERLTRRVVSDLGLAMSAKDLAARVSTEVVPQTNILRVSVSASDPRGAQQLTQAVAGQLISLIAELENPARSRAAPIEATLVDPAALPPRPDSPRTRRDIGLAVVLGLFLGVAAAVVRELADTRLRGPRDIAAVVDAALIGEIPVDSRVRTEPLKAALDARCGRSEAFRVLRTNVQFSDSEGRSKVFLVTSALPREGRTTSAIDLAISLARGGADTVLVDADLREPAVGDRLGLERDTGLSTILVGDACVADAVRSFARVPNLKVLPSGRRPGNPSELLQSTAMATLLRQLRETYDVVVIDAPSLLAYTDAALLSAQCDGALLLVRHGWVTKEQLGRAVQRLDAVHGRLFGVVLNMVPHLARDNGALLGRFGLGNKRGRLVGKGAVREPDAWVAREEEA